MNKKKLYRVVMLISMLFLLSSLLSLQLSAEEGAIYGHISYVENEVFVLKPAEDRALKGVVNLPIVPGDIVTTKSSGRCELQFDNGTIVRLGENTELKLDTVLSTSLTTKQQITTMQLQRGRVYTMSQVYKREIFQFVTPVAAVKMIKRSTASIDVGDDGESHILVVRGKVGVLYGPKGKAGDKKYLGGGKGLRISKTYKVKADNVKDEADQKFFAWNRDINKNFKELHYGKSKVPAVIYRRSPGIVKFAEKWSTVYGTWEYDELFGYVWKPADELFAQMRPFWDANYVRIDGELVLVPNQPWGWAPAHLGAWFFSKTDGWVWIPGDTFSRGICAVGLKPLYDPCPDPFFYCGVLSSFSTLSYYRWMITRTHPYYARANMPETINNWIEWIYGGTDLYGIYRTSGKEAWQKAYEQKHGNGPIGTKPPLDKAPQNVRTVIAKMDNAPMEKIAKHLTDKAPGKAFVPAKNQFVKRVAIKSLNSRFINKDRLPKNATVKGRVGSGLATLNKDWNPDSRWARKLGVSIHYSNRNNTVVCPDLKISSDKVTNFQKSVLRRAVVNRDLIQRGTVPFVTVGGGDSNSYSSSTTRSSTTRSGGSGKASGSSSGSGKTGATKK